MPIQFLCPYGHRLKVPDHRAGKKGRCPKCQQRVIVPVPNPIPSGREKRHWDASPGERIEIDDQITPPSSDDAFGDDPFLGGLIEDIHAPQPPAESPTELKQADEPNVSELEQPPEIVTFSADAPTPIEPPPLVPSPQGYNEVHAIKAPAANEPAAEFLEVVAAAPKVPQPPPLPPMPPALEPQLVAVQVVHAPPPAPYQPPAKQAASLRPRWLARARAELAAQSYRPDPHQAETVYWLAAVLLFVIVFTSAPALGYLQLDEAPLWAQGMLLVAGLQLAYAAWLVIVPDWSTVRVGVWLFAASAMLYAAASGLFAMAGGGKLPLEYIGGRGSAAGWNCISAIVLGLLSYACGQVCGNWRRADFIAYSTSRRAPQL